MNKYTLAFCLCFCGLALAAQSTPEQAINTYLQAYLKSDISSILQFTHPNILEMGGGEEFVTKDIEQEIFAFNNAGVEYVDGSSMDSSAPFNVESEQFYLVPHTWIAKVGESKYKSVSYLLASTTDEGKNWSVINIQKYSPQNLAVYIPGFDESIEFPISSPFELVD